MPTYDESHFAILDWMTWGVVILGISMFVVAFKFRTLADAALDFLRDLIGRRGR